MTSQATPLKFLHPGWFSMVMGLSGLSLAWHQASPGLGDMAEAIALVLGGAAALLFVLLSAASLLRWQRHPAALAEDLKHPVRHAFTATIPVSMLLLATVSVTFLGVSTWARSLWMLACALQIWVTVWVISRWFQGSKGLAWPGITPVLFIAVVGNVVAPLAGVPLGHAPWSIAQLGIGVFFWPVVLTLLLVRIGVSGSWAQRLAPTIFITVAPPAVIGLALLQLGASTSVVWAAWGIALFFVLCSATQLKAALSQPFALTFWAMSFPLAAFSALTLRLAATAGPGFALLGTAALALTSLVIASLLLGTYKGLRDGSLLAPEPVAMIVPASPG